MRKRIKQIAKTVLKFGLATAALWYVFSRIEFSDIIHIFLSSNAGFLVVALLLFIASKALAAIRLNIFFQRAGLDLPGQTNLRLYLLGMFYNLFLPGGIGGDGYKIYLLQKNFNTGTARLFGAVLTDRISGMSALLALALVLFSSLNIPVPYHTFGFALVPFVLAGLYLFMKLFYPYLKTAYFSTLLLSFGVQLIQLFCVWMILVSLGIKDQVSSYLLVFLTSSIVALVPVSVGGIGLRELTFFYGTQWLSIDPETGVGVSLMFYIITALVSLTGLWFVIRPVNFTKSMSL